MSSFSPEFVLDYSVAIHSLIQYPQSLPIKEFSDQKERTFGLLPFAYSDLPNYNQSVTLWVHRHHHHQGEPQLPVPVHHQAHHQQ
jgi:hypothetical protein